METVPALKTSRNLVNDVIKLANKPSLTLLFDKFELACIIGIVREVW